MVLASIFTVSSPADSNRQAGAAERCAARDLMDRSLPREPPYPRCRLEACPVQVVAIEPVTHATLSVLVDGTALAGDTARLRARAGETPRRPPQCRAFSTVRDPSTREKAIGGEPSV